MSREWNLPEEYSIFEIILYFEVKVIVSLFGNNVTLANPETSWYSSNKRLNLANLTRVNMGLKGRTGVDLTDFPINGES